MSWTNPEVTWGRGITLIDFSSAVCQMTGIALNINGTFGWQSCFLRFRHFCHKLPNVKPPLRSCISSSGERYERGCHNEPDGGGRLEDVEVLQDVWYCHQTQGSQEPESCIEKLPLVIF